jgi:predicted ester cyclase
MNKLLMILPTALILCFIVGCQDKEKMTELEEFKAQAAIEEQNKALVMRYFGAVENGDLEAVKEIFSPVCILHHTTGQDLSLEETIETVKKQNEQSKVMFPDLTFINEDTIVKGDLAVLMFTFKGTHTGDVEGIPMTGNAVEGRSITMFRFENGKIAEAWQESNVLRLYQQLGFELKQKEEK